MHALEWTIHRSRIDVSASTSLTCGSSLIKRGVRRLSMIFFTSYPKRPALPFLTDPIIHGRQGSLRPRTSILRKTYRVLFAYLRPALIPNDSHVSNEEFLLFAVRRPRGSLAIRLHIACLLFNSTAWPRVLALNQSVSTAVGSPRRQMIDQVIRIGDVRSLVAYVVHSRAVYILS